jgi:large subunit ribosomal protein L17
MRHRVEGRKLKRTASHRKALLASLSTSLIKHKKITTTTAKAKETRRIIEPIITRARDAFLSEKSGSPTDVHARREVARFIRDREAVTILFSEIAEKVGKRPGGYTRVLPLGNRFGDGASMSVIELVDYNEAQDTKKRRQRVERSKAAQARRKTGDEQPKKKGKAEAAAVEAEAPVVEQEEVVEAAAPETPVADVPAADAPAADAPAEEPKA